MKPFSSFTPPSHKTRRALQILACAVMTVAVVGTVVDGARRLLRDRAVLGSYLREPALHARALLAWAGVGSPLAAPADVQQRPDAFAIVEPELSFSDADFDFQFDAKGPDADANDDGADADAEETVEVDTDDARTVIIRRARCDARPCCASHVRTEGFELTLSGEARRWLKARVLPLLRNNLRG